MINFDQLVLDRCEDIFSIEVTVDPLVTQPGEPPYVSRGIYSKQDVDVVMQDDAIFSDHEVSLGIRIKDFAVVPDRGDLITITDARHPAFGAQYWVGDGDEDGQGGVKLLLRTKAP